MKQRYKFDEETLECPLCDELLSPPIHQCQNGHMACAPCCEKLTGKECPTCRAMPFAHSRSLGLEKIVESLRTTCLYASEGCTEMMNLTEREKHAKELCEYRQLKCPIRRCGHTGAKHGIPEHMKSVHGGATVHLPPGTRNGRFIMKESSKLRQYVTFSADKELFLVHIQHISEVSIPSEEWVYHPPEVMMFCGSSFGNDSLKYNLSVTVMGKEGTVLSNSGIYEVSASNNQMMSDVWITCDLIVLPIVNLARAEIRLSLTLL